MSPEETPGPSTKREALSLLIKGFMMGSADIVPGVSGGTVAYITGIYSNFINAIKSINQNTISLIFKFKFKEAFETIHYKFIGVLLTGIFLAFLTLSKAIVHCLELYPKETHALFLGLMTASILIVAKDIKNWFSKDTILLIVMAVMAYFITGSSSSHGVSTSPSDISFLFIFLCGIIAITAMILPGLSGSFLLKVLGVYSVILKAVATLTILLTTLKIPENFSTSLLILVVFASGCLVGITIFSRILSFCLENYHQSTIACITGLMLGALKCLWPWTFQKGSIYLPEMDSSFYICIGLALAGFIVVFTMDTIMNKKGES
ncbi:MAG: DUF368 domain-containing protein [Planctomycetota bacterium]|nr:MAG: DUF368 domain-containing protein [Planctomycetota bacterium]